MLFTLSLPTVHWPDPVTLGWGWGQPLEPNAGQAKQIQSLGKSQTQSLALSAPNGLRHKSPVLKGHSPVSARGRGLLLSCHFSFLPSFWALQQLLWKFSALSLFLPSVPMVQSHLERVPDILPTHHVSTNLSLGINCLDPG